MSDTIVVRSTERVVVPQLARAPVEVESRGPQGRPGVGIELRGTYATETDLLAAHPSGAVGDAYAVAGDLYVWDEDAAAWSNAGPFQGPPGVPDGITQGDADARYVKQTAINAANGVAGLSSTSFVDENQLPLPAITLTVLLNNALA